MKKIGIITFHRSYNCGSMMQAFALQTVVEMLGYEAKIINFSNIGQRRLYKTWFPMNSVRNIVKNIILMPHQRQLKVCNSCYEEFMHRNMHLSNTEYFNGEKLSAKSYAAVIAGSDQIWNITLEDSDDAYFLPWAKDTQKIAYAPSFGAKNILKYTTDAASYANYLNDFNALSVRENNGRTWIKDLIGKEVPVVLDPTLLLDMKSYFSVIGKVKNIPDKYIFYYAPHYDTEINKLVKLISKKQNLPVVAFNSKSYYVKRLNQYGFILPEKEDPSVYLYLIKNATLVITTSFHGTIFSSIFRKNFWTVKNGGMFGDDDRVMTITSMLDLDDRLIPTYYVDSFDYNAPKDYTRYEKELALYQKESLNYLSNALENCK